MNRSARTVITALLLLLALPAAAVAGTEEADRLFGEQNWPAAAEAYRAALKDDPSNGPAWMRLGVSLRRMEEYAEALEALEKAEESGFSSVNLHASLALTLLSLGRRDEAFQRLDQAVEAGLPPQVLETGPLFAGFREDERFQKSLELARVRSFPCKHQERYSEFDFWVGEWDVYSGGSQVGVNVIQRILEDCVIFENWTSARGRSGKSFNYYDPAAGKWRQNWVSDSGGVVRYEGEVRDGVMHYEGENIDARGVRKMARVTLTPTQDGNVHHVIEHSQDEGKTWYVAFDAVYVPKGSGPPSSGEGGL